MPVLSRRRAETLHRPRVEQKRMGSKSEKQPEQLEQLEQLVAEPSSPAREGRSHGSPSLRASAGSRGDVAGGDASEGERGATSSEEVAGSWASLRPRSWAVRGRGEAEGWASAMPCSSL